MKYKTFCLSVHVFVFREAELTCCYREELHSQDVHLPVLHPLLLSLLCGLFSGQVLCIIIIIIYFKH